MSSGAHHAEVAEPSRSTEKASKPECLLPVLDPVSNYEKLHRIGEGTYGVVYKAKDTTTGEIVALKKVRFNVSRDGVPVTSIRELRVLQKCQHPNIVKLQKVVTGSQPDSVFLVFEYCEHDLGRLLDIMQTPFSMSEVKCLLRQLLQGVAFLHENWVMHRDIKMSNLLYTRQGVLKLCDFGLARYFQPYECAMTPNVVTLWYRAPEVLLGCEKYTEAIDMWSVGCIFGELVRHEPLFPARDEIDCIKMICDLLGSPNTNIWPGLQDLPHASKFKMPDQPYSFLRKSLPGLSDHGLHLINSMLCYDPDKRITAHRALKHPFFTERPYPLLVHDMPVFPSTHRGEAGASSGTHLSRHAAQHLHPQAADAGRGGKGMDRRFGDMFDDGTYDVRAFKLRRRS